MKSSSFCAYTTETILYTTKFKNLLQITEIKTVLSIVGVILLDHKRNSYIREEYDQILDVARWSSGRRRQWIQ